MRNPVSTIAGDRPVMPVRSPMETMYDLGIVSGLNASATPFSVPTCQGLAAGNVAENVLARPGGYNSVLQSGTSQSIVTQSVSIGLPVNSGSTTGSRTMYNTYGW